VTTESTQPPALTDRVIEQSAAVQALLNLIGKHPTLPAPYITVHGPMPETNAAAHFDLQLDSPSHFEEWRCALEAPTADVKLFFTASNVWLSIDTEYEGIRVRLSGFNVSLTALHAQAPRDREQVPA